MPEMCKQKSQDLKGSFDDGFETTFLTSPYKCLLCSSFITSVSRGSDVKKG